MEKIESGLIFFEGAKGKGYFESRLQNILKSAVCVSGIKKFNLTVSVIPAA